MKTRAILFLVPTLCCALAAAHDAAAQGAPTPAPNLNDPAGFPLTAYAELGSSMGQSSHFGELGWTDEQVGAFLDGMVAAFHGKPPGMDDMAHRLSAEVSRRVAEIDAGKAGKFAGTFPLSAYAAFGASIELGGHFAELGWGDTQFDALSEGMRSAFHNKAYEVDDTARRLADVMGRRIQQIESGASDQPPAAFDPGKLVGYMKEAVKKYHLQMSDSGLGYNISPGRNGIRPRPGDTVLLSVHAVAYDGTTPVPQLSGDNVRSGLNQMFPGLREGLQMMTVGSQAIFVLPPALTFGEGEWPQGVQPGSPIVFQVALLDVVAAPATGAK